MNKWVLVVMTMLFTQGCNAVFFENKSEHTLCVGIYDQEKDNRAHVLVEHNETLELVALGNNNCRIFCIFFDGEEPVHTIRYLLCDENSHIIFDPALTGDPFCCIQKELYFGLNNNRPGRPLGQMLPFSYQIYT